MIGSFLIMKKLSFYIFSFINLRNYKSEVNRKQMEFNIEKEVLVKKSVSFDFESSMFHWYRRHFLTMNFKQSIFSKSYLSNTPSLFRSKSAMNFET